MSSPTTASTRSLSLSAIGSILASMFCFAVVDALAKTVALQYPANEVTFFRMLFGLVPAVAICCTGRLSWSERLANLDVKGQTMRALTLLGASGLFFAGLPYVPLGEAVALAYSETLIVILLAPLILHERLTRPGVAAAIAGFCGVLLVARPSGGQSSWLGPTLLLMSAFFGALSIVQIKRIRSTDDPETMVLFFTLVGTLAQEERDRRGAKFFGVTVQVDGTEPRLRPGMTARVEIRVTSSGFTPDNIAVPAAKPVTLVFTRKTESTCAKTIVIPIDGKKIEKTLPLNEPVAVTVTFPKAGQVTYACSMDMVKGTLVVQ